MNPCSNSRARRAGFTLMEMAIVLGIVGMALAGISVAYKRVTASSKIDRAQQEVAAIAANMRNVYAEHGTITGTESALTPVMDKMHVFPSEMGSSTTGILYNPWSSTLHGSVGSASVTAGSTTGGCNLTPALAASPASSCYAIVFYDVPLQACISLVPTTSQPGFGPNLLGIYIGSSNKMFDNTNTSGMGVYAGTLPILGTTASSACTGTGSIVWFYSIR